MQLGLSEIIVLERFDDVLVERGNVVLGDDEDPLDLGVEGVGDGDVNQAVSSPEANRWFATGLR